MVENLSRWTVCRQARRHVAVVCVCLVVLLCGVSSFGAYVELGPAASIAIDQPRVAMEVYTPGTPDYSYGPVTNTWLLDTGAQGLLSAGAATTEIKALGYATEGTYDELGLGGTKTYDVSAVYNFDFAGNSGVRNTLENVRILSDDTVSFGGFGGIVGMVAMVHRVSSLDLTPMNNTPIPSLISVDFSGSVPAGAGHRYGVELSLNPFPASGDPPLPSFGPLPFIDVEFQHGSTTLPGSLVLDTGAQISLLGTQAAFNLGLDANNDGNFDDEMLLELPFTGADGTIIWVPILGVDKLVLGTSEGIDLIWTDVTIGIVDIDPAILGVFGSDILTSGYLTDPDGGYIDQIHLDFTDSDNFNGIMYLDLNALHDNVVPEPAMLALLGLGALATVWRRWGI